jgi:hypothetical protein
MMHGAAARVAFNANLRGTPVYVGLAIAPIGAGDTSATEPTGAGYARAAATFAAATGTTGAATSNAGAIEFPTAAGDWGVVTHFAVFSAQAGGNLLFSGELIAPISVSREITVVFDPGALDLVF